MSSRDPSVGAGARVALWFALATATLVCCGDSFVASGDTTITSSAGTSTPGGGGAGGSSTSASGGASSGGGAGGTSTTSASGGAGGTSTTSASGGAGGTSTTSASGGAGGTSTTSASGGAGGASPDAGPPPVDAATDAPCAAHTDEEICASLGVTCGKASGDDGCGATRAVSCGDCGCGMACSAQHCVPNPTAWLQEACACDAECKAGICFGTCCIGNGNSCGGGNQCGENANCCSGYCKNGQCWGNPATLDCPDAG